jgi:hypothetical protein
MQQPLAYILQTLFQHEVFVITPTLNAGSRCSHVMFVMATRSFVQTSNLRTIDET